MMMALSKEERIGLVVLSELGYSPRLLVFFTMYPDFTDTCM